MATNAGNGALPVPVGMRKGPCAGLIAMTFFASNSGFNRGSLPASVFSTRPIASIDFVHNNVTTYGRPSATDGFYTLYPELCAGSSCAGGSNSGQYAAWSWGVSRLI